MMKHMKRSYRIDELYEFANEINVYELQDLFGFVTVRIIYRLTAIAIIVPPSQSHSLQCFYKYLELLIMIRKSD